MPEVGRLQWIFELVDKISPALRRIQSTVNSLRAKTVRYGFWVSIKPEVKPPTELNRLAERIKAVGASMEELTATGYKNSETYRKLQDELDVLFQRYVQVEKQYDKQVGGVATVREELGKFTQELKWNAKAFLEATGLAYQPQEKVLQTLGKAYRDVDAEIASTVGEMRRLITQYQMSVSQGSATEDSLQALSRQISQLKKQTYELRQQLIFLRYAMKYVREQAVQELPLGRPRLWFAAWRILEGVRQRMEQIRDAAGSVAWTFTWAVLSMLGVIWSFDAFLRESWGTVMRYVDSLSRFADAAFDVASWLAIASVTGQEWVKQLGAKGMQEMVTNVANVGRQLQATWGSLHTAIMAIIAEALAEHPEALKKFTDAFWMLIEFLRANKDIIADFFYGLGEGIMAAIPVLQGLINLIQQAGIDFRTLGHWVGYLAILFMALGPALWGFMLILQEIGGAATGVRTLASAFGWLAKTLGINIEIGGTLRTVFTLLRGVLSARLIPTIISLIGRLGILGRVIMTVWGFLSAHPIVLIVAAIALLVLWLYKVTDGFRNWQGVIDALRGTLNFFIGILRTIWEWLSKIANAITGGILGLMGRAIGGLLEFFAPKIQPQIEKPQYDNRYYEEGSFKLKVEQPRIVPQIEKPRGFLETLTMTVRPVVETLRPLMVAPMPVAGPSTVTIYQTVSVGTVRETVDVQKAADELAAGVKRALWGGY